MIVHIVAGGPERFLPDFEEYKTETKIKWIGVDRGTNYLLERGIHPDIAIGDFDSISKETLHALKDKNIHLLKYPSEKAETDMELALQHALKLKPEIIRIFGATGGRLDHFLANIQLFSVSAEKDPSISIMIIDQKNEIEIKNPGTFEIKRSSAKPYISFVPVTKMVENLTLEGFKYPLKNRHIFFGSTLCISNELIYDFGTYSFTNGILLVIRSCDD
ncbi:thiamine diphosphokinase [Caldifermentibacillus hisashii]|uniref:thiamine diphosphokinase n=1 Tax=Caldifermentibacillus hisashii TaxID=996558 RepID=UPI0022B9A464|nr:thiamine diphosphokinase [Caldifermentibacillus hisashii]MED4851353.1 thiamine diphosphokinase [Caldifermentibacillus hisashii]